MEPQGQGGNSGGDGKESKYGSRQEPAHSTFPPQDDQYPQGAQRIGKIICNYLEEERGNGVGPRNAKIDQAVDEKDIAAHSRGRDNLVSEMFCEGQSEQLTGAFRRMTAMKRYRPLDREANISADLESEGSNQPKRLGFRDELAELLQISPVHGRDDHAADQERGK
jgi:hypothetical protein